ncbi:MAG: ZIP family metal transporter [Candidatus Altiarchaeota archaeon]
MHVLLPTLVSVFIVSLISLSGVIFLSIRKEFLDRFLLFLVAFASGSMLAAAFLGLIPEAADLIGEDSYAFILAGIVSFFLIEKFIHWHHCRDHDCEIHPVAYLNLIGDGVHNFIDGVIITAGYMTSLHVGAVTTFAVLLHEIPQEIGDYAVLIHSGLSRKKALAYNFLSALTAFGGAIGAFILLSTLEKYIPAALAFAAGGFIYIATADLMPELHKTRNFKKMIVQSIALILGIVVIWAALSVVPHGH